MVSENLTVVFSNMPGSDVFVQGQEGLINAVNFNVTHGTLFITAKRNAAFYEGVIYLPVKNLAEINVKANSNIYSEGVMRCDNLAVYIGEGSHAELKTQGKLEIRPSEGAQLDFVKYAVTKRINLVKE